MMNTFLILADNQYGTNIYHASQVSDQETDDQAQACPISTYLVCRNMHTTHFKHVL